MQRYVICELCEERIEVGYNPTLAKSRHTAACKYAATTDEFYEELVICDWEP